MTGRQRREAVFDPVFLEDLSYWTRTDRKRALRTLKLVEAILRDPFDGIGKPEPLRRELAGRWSRRIDSEHRLVYQVSDDRVDFLAARYHY
ncbi:MAG: Txe/YoeB family addiction module toxin [Gemmatimonadetes bacterium]|nr:Txe/YoeB family addiction module toxin [Gemmatimonadota bacterium]MCY3677898.1 Txe/YoeB family addiction module toxin [Gemmatimonadota bacterium]MYA43866.1 Txe/YoeB family addiction module toxin [Gemmatimonadota bacterium]MYE93756.1 Txe/YoeB family addiction module toxin [Gemmatimonadota bacterium]MYJ12266.1 Txe/YoeB family addiction module toxin [Gemmatimonadota bacterium]